MLQEHCFDRQLKLNFLEESFGRHHRLQIALAYARSEGFLGEGVIQIDGDLAHEEGREIGQGARNRGRQEQAHHLLIGPDRFETAGEKNGAHERGAKADFGRVHIRHREANWM